jgi:hypothetical protein
MNENIWRNNCNMARKNRYEYSLLKEVYRVLSTITYSTHEDRDRAQRIISMVSEFLDKENVNLSVTPMTRPRVSERMGIPVAAPESWTTSTVIQNPTSYVVSNSSYSPMDYLNQVTPSGLNQAPRVDETEGENPF